MAPIIPAIARELANGARDVLRQGAAVVTGGQGEYIRSGEPESAYGKIQQATARQYCRRYADAPSAYGSGTRVIAENICRPYLNDIGYGGPGAKVETPFQGGRCATNYSIIWSAISSTTGQRVETNVSGFNVVGPINGIVSIGNCTINNTTPQTNRRCQVTISRGNGQTASFNNVPGSIIDGVNTIRIERVIRLDGQPDNCGSNPPDITDPVPPSVPGQPRERFNPGPGIDIDIGVDINPDGTINVDFGTGPITIDPFGDSGDDGGGGGGAGPGPGDIGEPGSPAETGLEGDTDGEAPPDMVLTGLKIGFVAPPVGGNEYKEGIYRGVCYIYMGTSEGVDHDPAGAMLRDGQFIFAEKDNLTHWFVSANRGYNLRVTPYYRPIGAEEE